MKDEFGGGEVHLADPSMAGKEVEIGNWELEIGKMGTNY